MHLVKVTNGRVWERKKMKDKSEYKQNERWEKRDRKRVEEERKRDKVSVWAAYSPASFLQPVVLQFPSGNEYDFIINNIFSFISVCVLPFAYRWRNIFLKTMFINATLIWEKTDYYLTMIVIKNHWSTTVPGWGATCCASDRGVYKARRAGL